jgi:hypothetical protein
MSKLTPALRTLALIALVGTAPFAGAQSYSVPQAVTGVTGGPTFSEALRFRPFGWSADGKFAWLTSRDIDGRGGTVYTYLIYDAVEDAVVYKHADDSFDWGTDVDATEEESWNRSGAEVSAALAKFGIVQSSAIEILAFPLQRSGDRYDASLAVQDYPDSSEGDDHRVFIYILTLSSRSRGSKVVTRKTNVDAADAGIDGYIISPKEPRILVVVSERKRGFEGYDEELFFYGAHLGVGFKK